MNAEIIRILRQMMESATFVNGSPTSSTFSNTTDSLESLSNNIDAPVADSTANVEMRDVIGNKSDAGAVGDPSATESLIAYLKQLVQELSGTAGIPTWPASAAPANTVSIAEAIRRIFDDIVVVDALHDVPTADATTDVNIRDIIGRKTDTSNGVVGTTSSLMRYIKGILNLVDTAESEGTFSLVNNTTEQTVINDTGTTRRQVDLEIDLTAMTQNGTIRVYRRTDGITLGVWTSTAFTASGAENIFDSSFRTSDNWRLTYQATVAEGAARNIPFNTITQVLE